MLGMSEGGGGSAGETSTSHWDIQFLKSLKRRKDQEGISVVFLLNSSEVRELNFIHCVHVTVSSRMSLFLEHVSMKHVNTESIIL